MGRGAVREAAAPPPMRPSTALRAGPSTPSLAEGLREDPSNLLAERRGERGETRSQSAGSAAPPSAPPRAGLPWLRALGFDPWLLVLVGVMITFGLVMVYSASWDVSWRLFDDPNALILRQLGNLVIGLAAMAAASVFPIRWLRRLALPLIVGTILVLFLLLLVSAGSGPRRAFLGGSVQPSEMAKLAVIIYLAVWMESKGERLSEWGYGFLPLMTIIGIVGGLILLQPDLSAVLTVAMVALVMFYLAG